MPENGSSTVENIHSGFHSINPFKAREEHTHSTIITYRVLAPISWLLLVVTATYYSFAAPNGGGHGQRNIWDQNHVYATPFTLNSIITSIYWIILFVLQVGYLWAFYSNDSVHVVAAANVGGHFVASNLLYFAFIHLWVRSHFWLAELILIINFANLSAAYFDHPVTPRFIHISTVSGPLAFNFVALYWVGAAMVHAHTLPARIVANIFIWGVLVYGLFFLVVYKDYTIGFELSILASSIGVAQFLTHVIAFQWIFAFVIMAVLFVLSVAVGVPGLLGRDPFKRGEIVNEDRERAPLLADD